MKFYGLSDAGELFGSRVTFARNPHHRMDPNCVEVQRSFSSAPRKFMGRSACEMLYQFELA